MYELQGKTALVTGASFKKGIGCGIALRLAKEGADVVVTDKHRDTDDFPEWEKEAGWEGLDTVVKEIETAGRRALAVTADLTSSDDVEFLAESTLKKFGKIDILVNNAATTFGVSGTATILELSEDTWNRSIDVNMTGLFRICKAVVKDMIPRKTGKIINISSIDGKIGKEKRAHYCASKFGIIGFTQSLALELAPYKINVNAICPGVIASWGGRGGREIWGAMKEGLSEEQAIAKFLNPGNMVPLGRAGKVEDVSNLVAFLSSSQSDYITGQSINICGGRMIAH